ncbi:MAG: response regulator, partial [Cyanobacteria bacterium J06649_11]
ISEASNGKEGLEKVESLRPDLILLDLVMPIMDGFETTEALRNNPEFKDLPVIIISANAMFDAQLSSYRIGCNAFLSKPIDLKLLIKSIAQLIDLEWIYPQSVKLALSTDKPTQQIPASQNTDTFDSILAPSDEEITQLLHLTQMGDIEAILHRAKQLESLDTKYLKFSQKVSELAQSFEQHKLLRFLEEFLK